MSNRLSRWHARTQIALGVVAIRAVLVVSVDPLEQGSGTSEFGIGRVEL